MSGYPDSKASYRTACPTARTRTFVNHEPPRLHDELPENHQPASQFTANGIEQLVQYFLSCWIQRSSEVQEDFMGGKTRKRRPCEDCASRGLFTRLREPYFHDPAFDPTMGLARVDDELIDRRGRARIHARACHGATVCSSAGPAERGMFAATSLQACFTTMMTTHSPGSMANGDQSRLPTSSLMPMSMTHDAMNDSAWQLSYDDDNNVLQPQPVADPDHRGQLRTHNGDWIALDAIHSIEGWISGPESGVRGHLADGTTVDIMYHDSGNIDFTASWNEYLYDGAWAFGAGRQLAAWLNVTYWDAWIQVDPVASDT